MISIRDKALVLLARREHSRQELYKKLLRYGYLPEDINQKLNVLAKENLQSDDRFCENYIRYRKTAGWGPLKILAELSMRGVPAEIIDNHLDEQLTNWQQSIVLTWKKRFNARQPADPKDYAKQTRFLLSRGYPAEWTHALLKGSLFDQHE